MRPSVKHPIIARLALAALPAMTLLLAGCGPDLRYERDPNVAIPAGATWAWSLPDDDGLAADDGAIMPADSLANDLRAAIEAELTTRGYPRAAPDSAAFIVHYHVGRRRVTDTLPPRDRPPTGDRRGDWTGYGQPETVEGRAVTWEEGMLIVDMLPRDRSTVAWRGVIAGEIPAAAERRPSDAIRAAVRRLMRDFPDA
jgi:hypothetical protein